MTPQRPPHHGIHLQAFLALGEFVVHFFVGVEGFAEGRFQDYYRDVGARGSWYL
jgi:hypothetical protein